MGEHRANRALSAFCTAHRRCDPHSARVSSRRYCAGFASIRIERDRGVSRCARVDTDQHHPADTPPDQRCAARLTADTPTSRSRQPADPRSRPRPARPQTDTAKHQHRHSVGAVNAIHAGQATCSYSCGIAPRWSRLRTFRSMICAASVSGLGFPRGLVQPHRPLPQLRRIFPLSTHQTDSVHEINHDTGTATSQLGGRSDQRVATGRGLAADGAGGSGGVAFGVEQRGGGFN